MLSPASTRSTTDYIVNKRPKYQIIQFTVFLNFLNSPSTSWSCCKFSVVFKMHSFICHMSSEWITVNTSHKKDGGGGGRVDQTRQTLIFALLCSFCSPHSHRHKKGVPHWMCPGPGQLFCPGVEKRKSQVRTNRVQEKGQSKQWQTTQMQKYSKR